MKERTISISGIVQEPDRIVRRSEAGLLLGRSPKTVDRLAEQGILQRVWFPNRKNAAGYRLSDLERLIASGSNQQDGYAVDEE